MSGLFKNKIIKAKLEGYEIPDFEAKLTKIKSWLEAYQNKSLHKKSESQCEQAFNQSFFIEILGYKAFPNEIYNIDPKGNTEASGQKPDAILGYFSEEKSRIIAVVEIKDVNTSLDKSQRREGNLSPVQQAFKYKTQYKECDFVIATNFFEIRLLKDNQLDFESFTLDGLVDPKNNYFEFRKFYYLLNAENFVTRTGQTPTLKLLSEIRIQQEQITKEFYSEYKELRQELIKNIFQNNQQARLRESFYSLAVEKAQKIIDRLVFICFCEDLGLLPDDKLQEVVFHTEKLGLTIPIWDIMKSFFTAIDRGSEKLGIPDGYNGELFKEDEALNRLKINDEICRKFVELGKYDFSEDLSVNILGHIFEQSISDLENLKNVTEKSEDTVKLTSRKESKRKKDGIYYTPDYIVDYIVKNSLGRYLEDQEQTILSKHGVKTDLNDENYHKRMKTAYEEYREILKNVKVLDPACGSGAFLVKVYDFLLAENERVTAVLTDLYGGKADLFASKDYIKSLLQDNIYGVDLNPESVEITKLSLWLKTARKGEKLVSLKNNIKCGNSLIDDPAIAGEKAFRWEREFSEIMNNGGFDVIVGNPPYLRIQGINQYQTLEPNYYEEHYTSATGRYDLYVLFIEKALSLINKHGRIGFILPHKFLSADFGEGIRSLIQNKKALKEIINFGSELVFQDASTYTCLIFLSSNNNSINFANIKPENLSQTFKFKRIEYDELSESEWNFIDGENKNILKKITGNNVRLDEVFSSISQGIVTIGDDIYIMDGKFENNYFVGYSERLKQNITLEKDIVKPMLKGEDVSRYDPLDFQRYVIYPHFEDNNGKTCPYSEEDFRKNFPLCYDYLSQFKEELISKKIKYKTNPKYWYSLHRSREISIFNRPKIITPEISLGCNMTFDEKYFFHNTKCYSFIRRDESINYKACLAILNSKLLWFYLKNTGYILRGGYFAFNTKYLNSFCLPVLNSAQQALLESKANLMLFLHNDFHEKMRKFLTLLKSEFGLEKMSQKLGKFYELDFDAFIKSLGIKKIDLQKKSELFDFFEKSKQELLKIKTEINKVDQTINEIVFDLYGLTPEEQKTVLDATI